LQPRGGNHPAGDLRNENVAFPRLCSGVEQSSDFFVSLAARGN
jgi:hypothetical protein